MKKKKKILLGLGALAILIMLQINTNFSENSQNSHFTLSSLIKLAQADDEGGCAGGSCNWYDSRYVLNPNTNKFEWMEVLVCSACCAAGQQADCTSFGCSCT